MILCSLFDDQPNSEACSTYAFHLDGGLDLGLD